MTRTKPIDELRKALGEKLDIHSAFTYEKFLSDGLDEHFITRCLYSDETRGVLRTSDYWKQTSPPPLSDGECRCPPNIIALAHYTRNVYNIASFWTKLPTLTKDGQNIWLGLEDGAHVGTGVSAFCYIREAGVEKLRASASGAFAFQYLDITAALPVDYKTVRHVYTVQILKPFAEFYIDNKLVGVIVNAPNLGDFNYGYPPYAIRNANISFSIKQTGLIEVSGQGEDLVLPLAPSCARFGTIDPLPPRVYRLYETGTDNLFAGKSISSGTLTSHPVPIFGYAHKTLYFMADKDSDSNGLVLEVLTQAGNWRTYDAVTYLAGKLWVYPMSGDAVLARLSYTPTSYPATVLEGEVILE